MASSRGRLRSRAKGEGQMSRWVETISESICGRGETCVGEETGWDRKKRKSRVGHVGKV